MRTETTRPTRRLRLRTHSPTGFTLIELLLVLVILGILAAVVVPKFTNTGNKARVAAARTDISTLESGIDRFELDAGRFPSNEEGLAVLVQQPTTQVKEWHGPYVKRIPNDPWGNPYVYRYPGQGNPQGFDLLSYGPNAQEGGGDDIDNWTTQ